MRLWYFPPLAMAAAAATIALAPAPRPCPRRSSRPARIWVVRTLSASPRATCRSTTLRRFSTRPSTRSSGTGCWERADVPPRRTSPLEGSADADVPGKTIGQDHYIYQLRGGRGCGRTLIGDRVTGVRVTPISGFLVGRGCAVGRIGTVSVIVDAASGGGGGGGRWCRWWRWWRWRRWWRWWRWWRRRARTRRRRRCRGRRGRCHGRRLVDVVAWAAK